MTTVNYKTDLYRMSIIGHAGGEPAGANIVCAGISALAWTLVAAATERADFRAETDVVEKDAFIAVQCRPVAGAEESCRQMFKILLCGFRQLEHHFPASIRIQMN